MRKKYERRELTDYEVKRNALIPQAEKYTNQIAGPEPAYTSKLHRVWGDRWNCIFHQKMNEMAKNMGLSA